MTEFTAKLLILGLPGIICLFLSQKLLGGRKRSPTEVVLLVFLYSMLSYVLVSLCDAAANAAFGVGFTSEVMQVFLVHNKAIAVM